jgi:hypothetical protein
MMTNIDGVKVVDYSLTREDFTCHGLHINAKGKSKVATKITQILTQPSKHNDVTLIPMHWIEASTDCTQLGSISEVTKKGTTHLTDKHEDEKDVKGGKSTSQTQPFEQHDLKLILTQGTDTTPGPSHRRSLTEVSNTELAHQEHDEHEEEEENEDKLPSYNHVQQKTSCRRKMIPHTRTGDFLWG